jgi:3-oxoacyl-[acyl-carrier-protein] synthase II
LSGPSSNRPSTDGGGAPAAGAGSFEQRRVVVTGIGLISPLGDRLETLFAALCEGTSALGPVEDFDTASLPFHQAGAVRDFDAATYLGNGNLRPLDRNGRLATAATQVALADAGWLDLESRPQEIGLVLGTLFGSVHTISEFDRRGLTAGPMYVKPLDFANSVINAAAGQTAIWHHLPGVNSTIAGGPTAGLQALAYAADLIRGGRAEVVVAGGSDELCFESYFGYCRAGLVCGSSSNGADSDGGTDIRPAHPRPFDRRRNGFAPAEAAAFLVLEEESAARRRGARILARLRGHASAFDVSLGADADTASGALARATRLALEQAGCGSDDIAAVSASAHGGRSHDRAEAEALAAVFGDGAAQLPVTAIKSMLGEPMGAGGALQAAVLAAALAAGRLPGTAGYEERDEALPTLGISAETRELPARGGLGLATAVGMSGQCAALVLETPGEGTASP